MVCIQVFWFGSSCELGYNWVACDGRGCWVCTAAVVRGHLEDDMVATLTEVPVTIKRRSVAPGELELASVAGLQAIAALALILASPRVLAGNGTALLTAAGHPGLSPIIKFVWAGVFAYAGYLAVRAIRRPSVKNRRVAWQLIIPLWACWTAGLAFPLFIGQATNVIVLAMCVALVNQWIITRLFVPLNGTWYDREVVRPLYTGE
jgi:hypothetical protein